MEPSAGISVNSTTSWSWATTRRRATVNARVRAVPDGAANRRRDDAANSPETAATATLSGTSCRSRPEALGGVLR
ncbi:hypothetical protein GCM10009645_27320 [Mycolicibacterium poriferae]